MSNHIPAEHDHVSIFEKIRRVNVAGIEYWLSRDLAGALGYVQYRNFETVVAKAMEACFNSGQRIQEHFADVGKMIGIGNGGTRKSQQILDHMGSEELAANLFRATQAESKIRRERIAGKERANQAHREIGAKVRQTIQEIGGAMPENLPTPKESAKRLETKRKKLMGGGTGKKSGPRE